MRGPQDQPRRLLSMGAAEGPSQQFRSQSVALKPFHRGGSSEAFDVGISSVGEQHPWGDRMEVLG